VTDPLSASALQLAAAVRAKQISPSELLEAHLARIEAVNGDLNAVVVPLYEQARARAAAQTEQLARADVESLPPLFGVPCTLKEFVGVEGQPLTGGIEARRHTVAERNSPVVDRLLAAGAVPMGLTNAPEGGLWHETNNPIYGRTSNPWDLHRTPGGSSGGEGAILAAGGSPFGIGSDTGGSIRMPAAFCGIAGHKPSGGLVPTTGHFPEPPVKRLACLTVGPMARHASDLPTLLRLIAGPDGVDPQCRPLSLGDPDEVDWSTVQVMVLEDNGRSPVRPEVRAGVHRAALALRERGATLTTFDLPDLSRAFDAWVALLSEGPASLDELVTEGGRAPLLRQLAAFPAGRARHTGGVLVLLFLERMLQRLPTDLTELVDHAVQLRDQLSAAIGPRGLLLHPPFPRTAPRHRGMVLRRPWDVGCTTLFNVGENPVTVVPVDTDARGLPVGVQIVGARGNDHLTLAAGQALEDAFGGWQRPVEPRWGRSLPFGLRLHRRRLAAR
jgi:fatty acid amide hydrolase 2